jgi:polyhydroxybutyrate depolymerase
MTEVKKLFIALSAVLVWTAIPAVSANAVSVGQSCAKKTLGTRVSTRINKKPVIVVCRVRAGRKQWIRAAVQTITTTTTSTSTTSTTVPEPVVNYTVVVDPNDPTLHTITIEGMQPRTYSLNVPSKYTPDTPVPLLLGFHGLGGSATVFREQSQIDLFTNDANVISVFPNGYGSSSGVENSWNAGTCCGLSRIQSIDDVKLVQVIIKEILQKYTIDTKNIWAVGFSNGGMFSYQLACDLSGVITAIGVGAGVFTSQACSPAKPVSVIHIHGGLDDQVPFLGGGSFGTPDVEKSFRALNTYNQCSSMPFSESSDLFSSNLLGNCSDGTEMKLINYYDQTHVWTIFWTKEILRFLFAHPRK